MVLFLSFSQLPNSTLEVEEEEAEVGVVVSREEVLPIL
jgi:hypothetical protein